MTISERKEREKEQRRQSILSAAETLFARNGLHNTNMDDVAAEAEISKGTIYLYFKNKDDLFFSVIEAKYEDYLKGLELQLSGSTSLVNAVQRLVNYQLRHSRNHHHFFRIVMSEQSKGQGSTRNELRSRFLHQTAQVLDIVTGQFDSRMEAHHRKQFSARTLALCVTGIINAHIMSWLISGKTIDLEKAETEINNILLMGIGK
ncbi:MAG: TetR/AcrR family transcriptional regulator [Fidelibacterota bacterium]